MLTDRYGLAVSTTLTAARDAYVEGVDLLLTVYPGAAAAFDRAIAADPGFALAHIGKARALQLAGDLPAMRDSLATAQILSEGGSAAISAISRSFVTYSAGQPAAALAAIRVHVETWPRDALVLSLAANQGGLIGMSGLAGREQALVDFLAGSPRITATTGGSRVITAWRCRKSVGTTRRVPRSSAPWRRSGATPMAPMPSPICVMRPESGTAASLSCATGCRSTIAMAGLYGHLNWHLGLFELHAGNLEAGFRLYTDAFSADDHRGAVHQKLADSVSFLWRSELAGHRATTRVGRKSEDFARAKFPRPGMSLADWHVALAMPPPATMRR